MCGIAGVVLETPGSFDRDLLRTIEGRLHHRGPDDRGWLVMQGERVRHGQDLSQDLSGQILLLSNRLAILDLTEAGRQPMSTADGVHHIVFNGEIYNFVELRAELEQLGHRFTSHSDTEVLLAAWAQWGREALPRLVGMFAFAVLDTRERKLFLARDFFGIKPLYYTIWDSGFAFASEPPVLLELPWTGRSLNPNRLYSYLRFGITDHGAETLFAEVQQVPAAHLLEIDLARPRKARVERYWDVRRSLNGEVSFADAATEVRRLFERSVEIHLRSDVRVGVALSGGIDSSANVMAMRRAAGNGLDLHTFTYVAEDDSINEERWAELVGTTARARMHKVRPSASELARDLDTLVDIQGEPFGSTSIYAQHRVFGLARESGMKVMLDGQGADELFAGYPTSLAFRVASLLRRGQLLPAARLLGAARRFPALRPAWSGARALSTLLPSSLQPTARTLGGRGLMPSWLNAEWFLERGVVPQPPPELAGPALMKEHLYQMIFETSLPMLLRYEDRNSMAFSIESRVPFLTPQLASFVLSLPEDYIIGEDAVSKAVFRKAMRGLVPDPVLDRTDKIGFQTPEQAWLGVLRSWGNEVLRGPGARSLGAVRWSALLREWEQMPLDKQPDARIWRCINLSRWIERFGVGWT